MLGALLATAISATPAPPALLDPLGAAAAARTSTSPRRRAETLLLTGHPEQARRALEGAPEGPRALRLLADTYVDEARASEGEGALARLEAFEGWRKHARMQGARLERQVWAKLGARIGLALFAICLAVLGLAGARELLRVHRESVLTLGLVGGACALAAGAGTTALLLTVLIGGTLLALGHAATAAGRRIRPGPRGRLFLVVLLLFGVAGAGAALVLGVGVGPLLGGLSAG